jgi:tetratricopeptide (TPR) repeat protein
VHQEAGEYEDAEAAYRRSLEIVTQINNRAGQASSLDQLGLLYSEMNLSEDSVSLHREAADIRYQLGDLKREGISRNNISIALLKLNRYHEARVEIMRAIECDRPFGHASEPWKTFNILRQIEEEEGNHEAARAAWVQARDSYLEYRRQGGYASQGQGGIFVEQIIILIQQGKSGEIQSLFDQHANAPDFFKRFMQNVITVINGSRDKALGDDLALSYADAAEVLFLIERLGG